MGNKKNKTIRRICLRKHHKNKKPKKNTVSGKGNNQQGNDPKLTILTAVDMVTVDRRQNEKKSLFPRTPTALPENPPPSHPLTPAGVGEGGYVGLAPTKTHAVSGLLVVGGGNESSTAMSELAGSLSLRANICRKGNNQQGNEPKLTILTAVDMVTVDRRQNKKKTDIKTKDHNLSETTEDYCVETSCEEGYTPVEGRRIVDIEYFINQLKIISSHSSLFDCNFKDMTLIGETRNGFICKYKFQCSMCKKDFIISNEDSACKNNVNANLAAVTGITSTGIGYSQFQEIAACMNVPMFSEITYSRIQNVIYEKWEATAVQAMEKAAIRERDTALAEGKVSKNGIPIIDVYADGVWSSRSYGNNYKALSGAAAIVGRKYGEVLFIGIKNKYCLVCARAEKKEITTPEHTCFKNYTGSSSGMEAEILCQGFENSIAMYNVIFGRLIADGDSATYTKILKRNPYPNYTVQKIECRNHLLRNMCNKLRSVTKDLKYPLEYRKKLTEIKILTIRKVIITSIKTHKLKKEDPESINFFRKDIQNSIYHAFGNHNNCQAYYCSKEKIVQSNTEIENTTFWFRIKTIIQSTLSKSQSLLEDVDTNIVEGFNSIVAKTVGGKRINFSLRRGYRARCSAAVLMFNNPLPRHTLHKEILGRSPKSSLKKFEEKRLKKRIYNKIKPHKKNRIVDSKIQHDYGAKSSTPDMTLQELSRAKDIFLENLTQLTSNKDHIQKSTLNQRDSNEWIELRKIMITASNFGLIVKRRETSSKAKLVQNILYKSNISHVTAVAHGIENEQLALQQLAAQGNVKIEPCGLFVDEEYPFIGATPDGLIGQDTIVEIKCPIVAFKKGLENAIKENKVQIWKYDKKENVITLNKCSNWFYQIQGQLRVTGKKKCLFAVWSGETHPIKTEVIEKDDIFWETKMQGKIIRFFMDWLLPELVDSRQSRGIPLRDNQPLISRTIGVVSPSSPSSSKRKLPLEGLSSLSEASEPSRKKQAGLEDFSTVLSLAIEDEKENVPHCSRQLTFNEM